MGVNVYVFIPIVLLWLQIIMVSFYGYKFSNMGMQGKYVSFYFYGYFL